LSSVYCSATTYAYFFRGCLWHVYFLKLKLVVLRAT
jgi:hypothetical protein